MSLRSNLSNNLFVANLQNVSLERLVKSKLEVLFDQQRENNVDLTDLYTLVMEQVEKPLIELALRAHNGNQVRTAQALGINRNTLKKKMDHYKLTKRSVLQGAHSSATISNQSVPTTLSAPLHNNNLNNPNLNIPS
ncbi:MAG: helix-turn-helix domain-containing protein [Bdellovibrionales bacterium]